MVSFTISSHFSKKLDETTAQLKRTAHALNSEKKKTDMLLHQMLPVKVADALRDGKKVEPRKSIINKPHIIVRNIERFNYLQK